MHIYLMFLTTALQVCDADGKIQTFAVCTSPSTCYCGRIPVPILHKTSYCCSLEFGIYRRSGNGSTAIVTGSAIIVAVGLRQQHQVARRVIERRGQVEVVPARVSEEYHVIHHQSGVQNLIVPIICVVRKGVQLGLLQV